MRPFNDHLPIEIKRNFILAQTGHDLFSLLSLSFRNGEGSTRLVWAFRAGNLSTTPKHALCVGCTGFEWRSSWGRGRDRTSGPHGRLRVPSPGLGSMKPPPPGSLQWLSHQLKACRCLFKCISSPSKPVKEHGSVGCFGVATTGGLSRKWRIGGDSGLLNSMLSPFRTWLLCRKL